ncbi:hypothetical protein GE253_19415 [Niveispirillum sp. SYP-B3756]|uniref:helix-turn-helix domain-containing protein n=1 Tax=Niveispirillum sp. SYP-B3756 TaxID=2662178 RepID=UPI0012910E4E|nr:helix-turn-helix domain-containing protein [Niveispirillum sp. SYP-B3756]MQP67499.1 hypothetical protein [Niveispirillum sp. SYP-B3756]
MAATRGQHKADIKSTLEKRGLTLRCLDRAHNLPLGTCSFTLREPHAVGEQVIAAALGVSPGELWPHRYRTDGVRLRPQPAANYRTPPQKPKTSETLRRFNANTIEQV